MDGIVKRLNKEEKGFTLVELLVVFSLLAVLAAIMIPNVSGFVNYGQVQAAAAELSIVQTAMDSMMAKENSATVNATSVATAIMSDFPDGSSTPLYPGYLRYTTTKGTYTNDAPGRVSQNTTGY
jgi:prepilin-type N-terminal cleavage/methylation domain-containing protein